MARFEPVVAGCKDTHVTPWEAARRLIAGAESLDAYARQHLQDGLNRSNQRLGPLREPLALNLGAHRWLAEDREESYSDWLAWILQGMAGAGEILPLFGLRDERVIDSLGRVESVRRECVSDLGRTDVEVGFGSRGLLLVEVKTKPPGEGLLGQLRRYQTWIERQPVPDGKKFLVLLAREEPDHDIAPFSFTAWEALCRRLRRHVALLEEADLMRAAAILIFCGAVEQNLLGFSARPERFRAMASVEYLTTWSENE